MTVVDDLACVTCESTTCERRRVLRSTSWDGPTPAPGDVLREGDDLAVVEWVTQGPGIGHFTLVACRANVIEWRSDR